MRKKASRVMLSVLVAALIAGLALPSALAAGEDGDCREGLPPELQEYQERVQEALESMREPLERVRELAEQFKQGRGMLVSALREKGREAIQAFSSDLRDYLRDWREVSGELRQVVSGTRNYRYLKLQVLRAVRSGDTQKAEEIIEKALGKVDEAKEKLESLASRLEDLLGRQAELLEKIDAWSPPQEEVEGGGDSA
jgi:chromosome segregation ATPase